MRAWSFLLVLAAAACADNARPRWALRNELRLHGGSVSASPSAPELTPATRHPHALSASECLEQLSVSAEHGLSSERAAELELLHGSNCLQVEQQTPLWKLFIAQFGDRLVQILLGVAALSYGLARLEREPNGLVEPSVIILILLINAAVGTWQEGSAQSALDALKRMQPETARCLRDGLWQHEMSASTLVPGDIVELRVGDKVPADARLVSMATTTFSADEGSLTGESATVAKSLDAVPAKSRIAFKSCLVFAGTVVTNGRALAVITATGAATEMGKIQAGVAAAKEDEEKSPLAQKIDSFGGKLTWVIGVVCIAVWAINLPRIYEPAFAAPWRGALYYLKVAVALGVAAIPEGLPAVITLCLSLGTRRMAKRNVIVRRLPSVETLGCTTVICTDKTGTLTSNQMTVQSLVLPTQLLRHGEPLKEFAVEGVSHAPHGRVKGIAQSMLKGRGTQQLVAACALCNDAELTFDEQTHRYGRVGEPTEAALKTLVEKLGVPGAAPPPNASAAANHYASLIKSRYHKLATLEFSRVRKSMSVLCRPIGARRNVLFAKGAPESVLARCAAVRLVDGRTVLMSEAWQRRLHAQFVDMARRPLRCLVLAVKENGLGVLAHCDSGEASAARQLLSEPARFVDVESGLVFLGMVGIKDPARPEVPTAILRCQKAGIRVIMITGDSHDTAAAIAKDVNIFGDSDNIEANTFSGGEFFALPPERQEKLLRGANLVFCRAEPADKQRLLCQLQKLGEVAAMTGDGVNDAPALQQAAIGIAMGITGTEVAKQAADMVLADDNFATIVAAVEEGRAIYANMKAFINFLITCNIGEVAAVFLATLLGLPEVLGPLHLLWVNLVTDGPPATALGFNPPDAGNMERLPRGRGDPLVTRFTLFRYLVSGSYVGLATIGTFVHAYQRRGITPSVLRRWSQCAAWPEDTVPGFNIACDAFAARAGKAAASTVALSTLVAMEMLRALCSVSERESLLVKPPWANRFVLLGVSLPLALHGLVIYCRPLAQLLHLVPLTRADWQAVALFALPLLLVEELLKWVARHFDRREAIELAMRR